LEPILIAIMELDDAERPGKSSLRSIR